MSGEHRVDRRTKYSLRVIQAALFTLLQTKDLDSITVTELCNLADVNRGTFYKYYRDIYDLYDHIEDDFVNQLSTLISPFVDESQDEDLWQHVCELLKSNNTFVSLPGNSSSARNSTLIPKLMKLVLPLMEDTLGKRRPDLSSAELSYLSSFILGGCGRLCEKWIIDGMPTPPAQMGTYISEFANACAKVRLTHAG